MPTIICSEHVPAAVGPYSQAMQSGGFIFTSGQLPIEAATGTIPDSVEKQARVSLDNVKAVLEKAGSSMRRVVKTTVFLSDMADFAVVNAVYAEYFSEPFPARSCVEVARLPKDVLVEIEVIAES